jgi:hypothetical protein
MKKIFYIIIVGLLFLASCENSLDLYPLSQATSETWYSSETEIQLALNDQYDPSFWTQDEDLDKGNAYLSDDGIFRNIATPIKLGTVTSQWATSTNLWQKCYAAIALANRALLALNSNETKAQIPEATLDKYIAEARFFRAAQYSKLIWHFGDAVYLDHVATIDEAFTIGRTDKNVILQKIYEDFDAAVSALPLSYSASEVKRVTKGAAYALKARVALYMGDFATAAQAAKACIDLGIYQLYPDYSTLFLSATKDNIEEIFALPISVALSIGNHPDYRNIITRNVSGYGAFDPDWNLMNCYLCTDGLPIDESPLYDPKNPWKNRDPRCKATIVEIGTEHLGYIYDPNPYAMTVLEVATGKMVENQDNRAIKQQASYNGLVTKKGVDMTYVGVSPTSEPDQVIIRYADVLIMYAEAKTELGQIDQSVFDAVNSVRARAYKVPLAATTLYPAITSTDQTKLRLAIRLERRMELAMEGLRYMDIVRWRLASKVLTRPIYGLLDPAILKAKVVDKGLWFFPGIPDIDEDGVSDFSAMEAAGTIKKLVVCNWNDRQYLWPIPTAEIQINHNMKQNPGY